MLIKSKDIVRIFRSLSKEIIEFLYLLKNKEVLIMKEISTIIETLDKTKLSTKFCIYSLAIASVGILGLVVVLK